MSEWTYLKEKASRQKRNHAKRMAQPLRCVAKREPHEWIANFFVETLECGHQQIHACEAKKRRCQECEA